MLRQLFLLTVLVTVGLGQNCGSSPADSLASAVTKNVYCYLKTKSYISGQTDVADAVKVQQMTGRYPAIVAFDFYRYTDGDTSETQKAIDWARQMKGIVAFQWHWKCPFGGEFYTYPCDFSKDIYNSNSKLHRDINLVMSELKKIGDAGIPVLFRPLHEANNNYMWWARHGENNYKALWKLLWDRAQAIGAHNLIWVFNGMASGQSTPMSSWYPGDNMVDVVSSDYFQSWGDHSTLKAIGNNKIIAISETFNQLNPASEPPFSHSVVWASRDWGGKGAENSWKVAMSNPQTISIDQLPNFNNPLPPSSPPPTTGGTGGCTDTPPDNTYTCAQQKEWGKCSEAWMANYCKQTCGRCSTGGTCTDNPPDNTYTCAQQKSWGKCTEAWMSNYCHRTCGRCSGGIAEETLVMSTSSGSVHPVLDTTAIAIIVVGAVVGIAIIAATVIVVRRPIALAESA